MSAFQIKRFGKWEAYESMNGGAQAFVYKVREVGSTETFVLKELKPWTKESKQENAREQKLRFIREVSTLETLNISECPRIVEVIDSNLDLESDESLWYVMPFYAGGAMRRNTEDGGPGEFAEDYTGDIDRVLSIGADLAETIAVIQGGSPQFLHRDIHTQNIFFGEVKGPPILGDFGLTAKGKEPKDDGTRRSEGVGPWRWRPVEMRPGSDNKREPGSDIYLIGGVIYEALTGGKFIEETQTLSGAFVHEKDEYSLTNYSNDPRVPLIATMLRQCFARDPNARFSAEELRKACLSVLSWRPGEARPDLGEKENQIRAAEDHARRQSRTLWFTENRDELGNIVARIGEEVANLCPRVSSPKANYKLCTTVNVNSYDQNAVTGFEELTGEDMNTLAIALGGIRVTVEYSPDPRFAYSATVLIWRDRETENVGMVSESGQVRVIRSSFHGDPEHSILIRDTVLGEIDRLEEISINTLNSS